MEILTSFKEVANNDAKILILGSMPGHESLIRQQYYAHPRNLFWEFICEILDYDIEQPYESKLEILKRNNIALWDVAYQCKRSGSLDSNIEFNSTVANDFISFYILHPDVNTVFFNGKKAEELYKRLVLKKYKDKLSKLNYISLPSTSPANASFSKNKKHDVWLEVKRVMNKS